MPPPLPPGPTAPPLRRLARRAAQGAQAAARRAVRLTPHPQPPWQPTRYPVVLLHGFGALAAHQPGGMLHAEAMHLRAHGVAAYAPTVTPYDTVPVRAQAWAERLDHVLSETGADKLNLIGFSTGGLDARHLAGPLGWADRIASIVTVSTPHRGTALAQFVLDHPALVERFAVGLMDWVGRAAYAEAPPRTAASLAELTPEVAAETYGALAPPEGVYCASYAASAGRGTDVTMYPPLVFPNRILHRLAGPNDGIVPAESAWWGERLGVLPACHARQVGLQLWSSEAFESRAFYLRVASALRERGL